MIFLTKVEESQPKEYRTNTKDLITYNKTVLMVSNEMYKGTDKSFFYGMVYKDVTFKKFRKHYSSNIEIDKIFKSGKTQEDVLNQLKEEFDISIFYDN